MLTIVMLNIVSAEDINVTQGVADNTNDYHNTQSQQKINEIGESATDSTDNKETNEYEDDVGEGCCTTILQGYNNDSAISFRRDETHKVTLNVKHNSSFIKQYKTGSYSFHVIVDKKGWLVGTGGVDNEYVNRNIESNAITMINNNQITKTNMNNINNLVSGLSLGHFVIKAPNGTYNLIIKRGRTYKESGVLKSGQYLVVPNSIDYFHKGTLSNFMDEKSMITSSRLLAAKNRYGINRREIVTYYYKNNIYNSTVKVTMTNDNGKYVNVKSSHLIDNVQTNNKYYSSSSIPIIDNFIELDNVYFFIKNQSQPTHFILDKINNKQLNDNVVISGRYVDNKGNNLTYTPIKLVINSKEYSVKTDGHGIFSYNFKAGLIGKNNVSVSYQGNNRYKGAQENISFDVTRIITRIVVNPISDLEFGSEAVVSGRYVDSKDNNLTYTPLKLVINSKEYTVKTNADGIFKFVYKTNKIGKNNVSVSYQGNNRYAGAQENISFDVTRIFTKIVVNPISDLEFGCDAVISGRYVDSRGTNLTYTPLDLVINSRKYIVKTDSHGVFSFIFKAAEIGKNNLTISYPGNNHFMSTKENISFEVTRILTKVLINSIPNVQFSDDLVISGRYIDSKGNNLTYTPLKIMINSKEYTIKTNKNGIFNYTYKTDMPGTNHISISYKGNSKYEGTTENATFNVVAKQTMIIINNIVQTGNQVKVLGKYMDISGRNLTFTPLTINVDNNIKTVKTNAYGEFVYEYKPLSSFNKLVISYSGNKRYAPTSQSIAYTLNGSCLTFSKSTIMTINNIENVKSSNVVKISGKYVDKDGTNLTFTPVKININGKTYNTKTDAQGYFSINYLGEKVGVYTVIASYHGNMGYSGTSVETSFMVLKA